MEPWPVKRKWGFVSFGVVILFFSALLISWKLSSSFVVGIIQGSLIPLNNIISTAFLVGIVFLMFGTMCFMILSDAYTYFDNNGIHRPGLFSKSIRWGDIAKIENLTFQLKFTSKNNAVIQVNLLLIKEVEIFLQEIEKRAPTVK